jgi:uncharacterized oxidoreductase
VGHREDGTRMRVLNGMLSILIDPAALAPGDRFESEAGAFIEYLLGMPAREGYERVLVAGDPERAMRIERTRDGVPVDGTTWQQILEAAQSLKVSAGAVQRAAGL